MTATLGWAEAAAKTFETQSSLKYPGPMELAMGIDSSFVSRPHLEHLSRRVQRSVKKVEQGHAQRIIVSLPPRTGKQKVGS